MILCCGEALIDMLPRTTTQGEPAFAPYVGGAVFNTAIALGRLGAPAGFFSGLSSDLFGGQFREALGASKVSSTYAHTSPRPTTLAFVRLNNGQATYTFYDENTAGRMLTIEDLPQLGGEIEAMLFGAISLISEPAGSAYEEFMRREHEARVMMLDPNIRPNFIPDKAKHLRRIREMMAMADIVKLSDEDLNWFGEAGSHEDVVRNWLDRGPKLIVVTHGSEGAVGYSKQHRVTVMPETVKVVDTVGAGDTFNAGILASLHEQGLLTKAAISSLSQDAIGKALALGAKAAAVTVSRAGANSPWRHEIG
ncbi:MULTISPECIES: carbohydrate kinase [unclassified Mesorhizobium]|uniref:carbohydrate kinase family protein n=2 Tax=Mesorhizobium TaxID=68287 RepID=UPI000FD7B3F0|nr:MULTISPECIES: carbohydrate kinase [unclassified Mesorhizobium]TGR58892.1 carbohydrate kinase [bacterium M00.F.Ca.ET.199.01.1.1]TGU40998.1 carbohydrate kinase [bacterium M00.F.Ca.ET.156.01.1.1]TGV90762.1 carbohydrate kinase [Mesorhizobium sp. M00.F.Ca.ET.149.01.1.1]TIS94644.1 MAG: carbohydrate kinase [Mesorhizobium sp.]TGP85895.1 carbohydrate kinase [Mesorhizobium sp. M8A.F.Ca.ET.218.01.1.1]